MGETLCLPCAYLRCCRLAGVQLAMHAAFGVRRGSCGFSVLDVWIGCLSSGDALRATFLQEKKKNNKKKGGQWCASVLILRAAEEVEGVCGICTAGGDSRQIFSGKIETCFI